MITWDEFPKVDVDFMNADHESCIEAIADLLTLFETIGKGGADVSEADVALSNLLSHLKAHFAREEQAMEETHFPPYYVHKTEHESVLQQFQQVLKEWQDNRDLAAIQRFIKVTFVNWLETHALTMDMVTAQHIARSGSN